MIFVDESFVENPLISICIPTFNQEKYIRETLDSILAQSANVPYEIIIADDCSSDRTASICEEYQRKFADKIKYISNKKNQGLVVNLFDTLLPNVRGKYIALCAGDDVWIDPRKIESQLDILSNNDSVSVVHTRHNFYYDASNTLYAASPWVSPLSSIKGKDAVKDVIFENFNFFPLASSIMFRKETIDRYMVKYGGVIKDKHTVGEGLILYCFFALDGFFECIPDIMVNYRVREKSASHFVNKDDELSFKIKYRIHHKALLVKTFLYDGEAIKRVHRGFLSLYLSALEDKTESTFFKSYNDYKKKEHISASIKFFIWFFSNNFINKIIYMRLLNLYFSYKNKAAILSFRFIKIMKF